MDKATQVMESVAAFSAARTDGQTLWPCLVGPTGCGKTTRVRALAERFGLECYTLLLGTMLPEDVLGLPKVERDTTQWSRPAWAQGKTPRIILLDELDKARPETLSTVLTLLAERRVRDHVLPPGSMIVAAMQPIDPGEWLADETGAALSARLVFVPLTYDWQYVSGARDWTWLPAPTAPHVPVLPAPAPRQIEWLTAWYDACVPDEGVRDAVVSGVVAADYAAHAVETLRSNAGETTISGAAAVAALREMGAAGIDRLAPAELIALAPEIWQQCDAATIARSVERIYDYDTDVQERFFESLVKGLIGVAQANDGKVEVAPGEKDEALVQALNEVAERIHARLQHEQEREGQA